MQNKKPTISSMPALRYKLTELWDAIQNDEIPVPKGKVLNATAANIIKTVMAEDFHNQVIGEVKRIDFMDSTNPQIDENHKSNS